MRQSSFTSHCMLFYDPATFLLILAGGADMHCKILSPTSPTAKKEKSGHFMHRDCRPKFAGLAFRSLYFNRQRFFGEVGRFREPFVPARAWSTAAGSKHELARQGCMPGALRGVCNIVCTYIPLHAARSAMAAVGLNMTVSCPRQKGSIPVGPPYLLTPTGKEGSIQT